MIAFIRKYNIARRLEFFVLDNVKFNNTCVDAVLKAIRLDLEKKTRRLRYLDYIMNLVAQALLFDTNLDAFTIKILIVTELRYKRKLLNI